MTAGRRAKLSDISNFLVDDGRKSIDEKRDDGVERKGEKKFSGFSNLYWHLLFPSCAASWHSM